MFYCPFMMDKRSTTCGLRTHCSQDLLTPRSLPNKSCSCMVAERGVIKYYRPAVEAELFFCLHIFVTGSRAKPCWHN
jgi:hypothetical protein